MKIILRDRTLTQFVMFIVMFSMFCTAQAQDDVRQKIGLVLSGGGARGAAHVGVIKVLDELRIPIDYIAGTSMGAIVGGLYASGMSATELSDAIDGADWVRLLADKSPRADRTFRRKEDDQGFLVNFDLGIRDRKLRFPKGLVQGQNLSLKLRNLLKEVVSIEDFDNLPIPFRAIAADIVTGEEVVLSKGDLVRSIRASMSAPGIFKPTEIDGQLMVDGGIVNNLPINIVKQMGADILIVVDVGSPLEEKDSLNSVLKVTSQMLVILIKKHSDQQKKSLTSQDVLITPELGKLSSGDFSQVPKAMHLGEDAARNSLQDLSKLSIPEEAYAMHRRLVQQSRPDIPVINSVVIKSNSRLSPEVLRRQMSNHVGEPLDADKLEDEIANMYGVGVFETIDYSVSSAESGNELLIETKNKDWGPNYLRFGVNLEDDYNGTSNYNLAARLTATEINNRGGEVRADIIIGDSPALSLELYQPLDYGMRWFVNPRLSFQSSSQGLFADDNQIALVRSAESALSLSLGRNFDNWGELRIVVTRNSFDSDIDIGDPDIGGDSSDVTSFGSIFSYDTIDRIAIPRYGINLGLSWLALRDSFGGNQTVDSFNLFFLKPQTWEKNTLLHWWDLGTIVNEDDVPFNAFTLGGLFNLTGYSRNELSGQHLGIGRMLYYHRLGSGVMPVLDTPVYLGGSIEAGNVWQNTSEISASNTLLSGSVFVIVDTVIGPLYFAYGTTEDGRDSAYLFLGQTF